MLNVDKFFSLALTKTGNVSEICDGRIFNPGRTTEDEDEDKIPYVIVSYEGGQGQRATDDDGRLAVLSSAQVTILCVAEDRERLATLTEEVHSTIVAAFKTLDLAEGEPFGIEDATESAGPVMFDPTKPCCFQQLNYNVNTYENG